MLFDSTLLFFGSVSSTGTLNFSNMLGVTASSASGQSTAINLGTPRDLGVGTGMETPKVSINIGTAFTSSQSTQTVTINFQGSTNSTNSNFTTYETWTLATSSLTAGAQLLYPVPMRPPGAGLPQYYSLQVLLNSVQGTSSVSTGTIFAGIVLEGDTFVSTGAQYPANFTVA